MTSVHALDWTPSFATCVTWGNELSGLSLICKMEGRIPPLRLLGGSEQMHVQYEAFREQSLL